MNTLTNGRVSNGKRQRGAGWLRVALPLLLLLAYGGLADSADAQDVVTQRNDTGRNGAVLDASITPASFSDGKWQRLASLPVDGTVYAQPLFVRNLAMPSGGTRNVVYIATARNKLYAFDADTHQLIWSVTNLPGPDLSDNAFLSGCTTMSPTHLVPTPTFELGIGIQSTGVIDRTKGSNGYLYFTYRTATGSDANSARQYIARVNLATGAIGAADKVEISGGLTTPVSSVRQRASLLLQNGVIYVAFGSHCEELSEPGFGGGSLTYRYRGAVLAVDQVTLNWVGRFETLPAGKYGGGIWMASTGLAGDSAGSVYFTTGNALPHETLTLGPDTVSSSFVRLQPNITVSGGRVTSVTFTSNLAADYFTPWRAVWQDKIDLDLGSAGVIVPPGTNQLVSGGKEGIMYVLNRNNLGKLSPTFWGPNGTPIPACAAPDEAGACNAAAVSCYTSYPDSANAEPLVAQKWVAAQNMDCVALPMGNWGPWPHIHGTPVYGRVSAQDYLYVWPEKGQLKAYRRNGTGDLRFHTTTPHLANATTANGGMPGGMLSLATHASGSGVVFASLPLESYITSLRGALVAFDATPQADGSLKPLWGDYQEDYYFAKFAPPTVANGKVFLATFSDKVNVYGRTTTAPVATASTGIAATLHNVLGHAVTSAIVQPDGRIAIFGESNDGAWALRATLGVAGEFPPGAQIAFGYQGTQLDVFAVGNDGKLHMFWTTQSSNPTVWFPTATASLILPSTTSFPPGAPLTKINRGSTGGELDVFVVDNAGDLHKFAVQGFGSWSAEKVLPAATPKLPLKAGLAADFQRSGSSSRVVVFATDVNGALVTYTSANTALATFTRATIASTSFLPGARIATGHQVSGGTDILHAFLIGGRPGVPIDPDTLTDGSGGPSFNSVLTNDGALTSVSATNWGAWTVRSLKRKGFAPGVPGSSVTAINQGANQLDVFFVGENGAAQIYFVGGTGTGWFNSEIMLYAQPGAPITAVAQALDLAGAPAQVDLLVPNTNGIHGSFVTFGAWSAPFRAL